MLERRIGERGDLQRDESQMPLEASPFHCSPDRGRQRFHTFVKIQRLGRLCLSSPLPASVAFTACVEGKRRKRCKRDNHGRSTRLRFEMMSGLGRFSRFR
ncbi:hypothetical protein F2P79_009137 [Pimephales promelas]|nr:hypothetical protein F2P79_009137 [Pimephales promelas]